MEVLIARSLLRLRFLEVADDHYFARHVQSRLNLIIGLFTCWF